MQKKLDLFKHTNGLISIKDREGDIDITDEKWDFIFEKSILKNWSVYFKGWRLDFIYEVEIKSNLRNILKEIAKEVFIEKDDCMQLFIEISRFDRSLINSLWKYYEYSSIIFLENNLDQKK